MPSSRSHHRDLFSLGQPVEVPDRFKIDRRLIGGSAQSFVFMSSVVAGFCALKLLPAGTPAKGR
jgi:hypothetical protein